MIDVSDWDDLVRETYGRPYSFQQQEGCRSRGVERIRIPEKAYDYETETIPEVVNGEEMGVSFAAWLARDPKQYLEPTGEEFEEVLDAFLKMWWERNFYPDVQMVANDLHAKGLIEEGEYLINIDW